MKKTISTILLILVFLGGLGLMLYPSFADWYNSQMQNRMISDYVEKISAMDSEDFDAYWEAAYEYNEKLARGEISSPMNEDDTELYNSIFNAAGDGIIGYIDIPLIKCTLPIYHSTSDEVLDHAIGHIGWTSLPSGSESTHSVLSGHRGLPSAKLFSNLDVLKIGDTFTLEILDRAFTYEIDQIVTVEPSDTSQLKIEEGKDYVTLLTCTPYGVNTHRLLVRGHRIEEAEETEAVRITATAIQIEPVVTAPIVAIPMILILVLWLSATDEKHKFY